MESPAVLGEAERQQRLSEWSASSGVNLARLDSDQRAVVVAALSFLGFVGGLAVLRRMVAYLLAHCGMGLSSTVIGGLVAKFLSEHRRCSVAELLGFIHKSFGVTLERHTLRRFLERYGLGCLREETVMGTPLFSAARPMGAPSH
jgi:hypothetical protein